MTRPTGVRWRILLLLIITSFVAYVLRANLSNTTVPIMDDLGIDLIQMGYALAALNLGYALFQFPGGLFSEAVGLRRAFVLMAISWAALTFLTAMVPGESAGATVPLLMLVAVRFLMGACSAPLFPTIGALIQRWFPLGGWGLPNGLTSTGLTLGAAAVPLMLLWLMLDMNWRTAYLILAPLGLVTAALCWWYLRDGPEEHSSVNVDELALINANRPHAASTDDGGPTWMRVLKNRNMQFLTLSYFCANYVFYNLFNWVPYYFSAVRGFDDQQAGFVVSVQWIAAAIGAMIGGIVCDIITRRVGLKKGCRWTSMAAMTICGVFLLLASTPLGPTAVVLFMALGIFFMQVIEAPYWAAAIGIGGRHTAAAGGMMNTGGNAIGVVNALLVPFIASTLGWPVAMATSGIFALIAAGLWFFISADEQIPD